MVLVHTLKKILILSWFALLLASCQQSSQFQLLNGEQKSISDYQGDWLLINFWAEWCPPCLKEIPELNALEAQGIKVIAVSYDKLSNQELLAQKQKYQIEYQIMATEPMPYLPMERPTGLPANYLFTPKGQMIGPLLGKQDQTSILALIEKIESSQAN
ncbi:TlpA disulfide reductase family protein [Kangiella sp. TOML190]|uniref:TlpA family protein disulfide reductase n=1 Tax=Kangiella sp. TOML190 TaxID=2931351 RepID=UPI0020407CCC|nr:TlpA disulfide reductase family protein [Kangiella sp. TOML190]